MGWCRRKICIIPFGLELTRIADEREASSRGPADLKEFAGILFWSYSAEAVSVAGISSAAGASAMIASALACAGIERVRMPS